MVDGDSSQLAQLLMLILVAAKKSAKPASQPPHKPKAVDCEERNRRDDEELMGPLLFVFEY